MDGDEHDIAALRMPLFSGGVYHQVLLHNRQTAPVRIRATFFLPWLCLTSSEALGTLLSQVTIDTTEQVIAPPSPKSLTVLCNFLHDRKEKQQTSIFAGIVATSAGLRVTCHQRHSVMAVLPAGALLGSREAP